MNKRIIFPPKHPQIDTSQVSVVPKIESLLSDALVIMGAELARYRAKVQRGSGLDLKESRCVREFIDSITKLSKESREAARAQDLSNLTNEELLQLAVDLLDTKSKESPKKEESSVDNFDK